LHYNPRSTISWSDKSKAILRRAEAAQCLQSARGECGQLIRLVESLVSGYKYMPMLSESAPDVKFEIGHVLFIDIVGYSKLLITEQSEKLQKLKQIVRGTEQFRLAEAEGKLLRLPTGDGGALVFHTSPEAPVLCALEISKALKVILNFESEWVFTAGLSVKSLI